MTTECNRIYLASLSPRRKELLTRAGIRFDALLFRASPRDDPETEETQLPGESASEYVVRLASAKAAHGLSLLQRRSLPVAPVLAADTTLELGGKIIGKPADASDAIAILQRLSGVSHRVLTAVAIVSPERQESVLSVSEVFFRELQQEEIIRYTESGDALDKAGAYGIQGMAGLFIERVEGSDTGIMGLPLCATGQLLKTFGYRW